jgi:DNA-binding MarR family transcriptional regulator
MNENSTKTSALVPADFYRGESYDIDESLGHLCKQLINSMGRRIDVRMAEHGLTALQWKPLLMIKLGRADTAADLARQHGSDTGAMTRMLDRLEAKGLLQRKRSETDRRVVHLELTDEGARISDLIPYGLSAALNEHLAGFDPAEFEQMRALLKRMIANGARAAGEDLTDQGQTP